MSDDRPPEDNSADKAVPPGDDTEIPTPTADPAKPAAPLRLRTLLIIAAVLLGLDLLTKTIVVAELTPGDPVPIIGDFARLSLVRNPGAAFSMATGMTWLLTLVAAAVVIGVIRIGRTLRSLWWAIGLGMVLGGALGNLVDRLFRAPGPLQGHVVDFIAVGWWPVFNLADSSIVCGAILLVVLTVFGFEPDGTRAGHDHTAETAAETAAEPDEPSDNGANGAASSKGNAA
ncbi:signal peptidase II [Nocardia anaemiae]|uniref:signal peptidase II n=1 Tax=Nocardia anaemiae TaxID=263910 RepID=UPI0007A42463|nr:signal peptidase II [Nocardia anaemiae]